MPHEEAQHGLTCWLLDTRSLWPGNKITDSEAAKEALQLISQEERDNILKKYHVADAKMSLGSALLKRLFVFRTLGIPWKDIVFGRKRDPKHGKPCALMASSTTAEVFAPAPLEFNISHQNGLVALVGCKTAEMDVELGVDIVCVNERNDTRTIDEEGFDNWIDMFQDIYSQEEMFDMKYHVDEFKLLDGTVVTPEMLGRHDRCVSRNQYLSINFPNGESRTFDSDLLIDAKLRRFYTYWCYKEAYIKLDGEALLANWIPQLEFKHVRAPRAGTPARCSTHGIWGERVTDAEVWWSGSGREPGVESKEASKGARRLADTRLEIQALEEDFMIGVAAKEKKGNALPDVLTNFVALHLEEEVMRVARTA